MRVYGNETYTLTDFNVADGVWTADSAPIFNRRRSKLNVCGTVGDLEENETFYVELWKGDFEGLCYFMRVVQKHDNVVDCAWLTKKRQFLRNINGGILFSDVPKSTVFYRPKKKRKRVVEEAKNPATPAKKPKKKTTPLLAAAKTLVSVKEEPELSRNVA